MKTKEIRLPARERILARAEELFYSQGYQATGINQIIDESGVAKATFYAHFPSKDQLCLAYLKTVSRRETELLHQELERRRTPLSRYMCIAEILLPWLEETNMKGCTFLNMVPEVVDPKNPLRREGVLFYRNYEKILKSVCGELIASDREKYGRLKAEKLAKDYLTIVAGAIALVELYHELEPMRHGIRMVRDLIE